MPSKLHVFTLLLCFALLVSCKSVEVFKEKTELPIRKYYASFVLVNKELDMQAFTDPLLDEQVKEALITQLMDAGMVYDAKKPELVIRYHSNEDPRQRERVNGMNPYTFWGMRMYDPWLFNPMLGDMRPRVSTSNYELLQIIVDFIDPKEEKYLMTLTAVTEVTNPKTKPKVALKALKEATVTFLNLNLPNAN
jgi:hypothetical protein